MERGNLKRLLKRGRATARRALGRQRRDDLVERQRREFPLERGRLIRDLRSGLIPDWCYPLDDPTWLPADEARAMRDDDAVIGFDTETSSWAFPWWVMKNHHLAQVELEGRPYLVVLCEKCAIGAVFDPVFDGTLYHFRIEGIYNGAPVAIDHETGSIWSLALGYALSGPAQELLPMERFPVIHATWADWRAMRPDTRVIDGTGESREGHGVTAPDPDHRHRAFEGSKLVADDPRLDQFALVLAVQVDGEVRGYSLENVHRAGGLIADRLADVPIVVVAPPRRPWAANVFERRLDGEPLELTMEGDVLVEQTAGRCWDVLGRPQGTTEAPRLRYVRSGVEKWFALSGSHPNLHLWEAG